MEHRGSGSQIGVAVDRAIDHLARSYDLRPLFSVQGVATSIAQIFVTLSQSAEITIALVPFSSFRYASSFACREKCSLKRGPVTRVRHLQTPPHE